MGIRLSKFLYQSRKGYVAFWCPGCKTLHDLPMRGIIQASDTWIFDGNVECPSFHPSVNCKTGHYTGDKDFPPPPHCDECAEAKARREPSICTQCHTWIKNGQIQFLNDCTHELKGQTVPLPPLPDHVGAPLPIPENDD